MKRHLPLAASVVALSVMSHQLFAAELEPAAPQGAPEQATPAPERAAPAAARPARERAARPARTPVQRQVAMQSSPTSSFTGSQVGGFGGGNAGGSGFADPATCSTNFSSLSSSSSFPLVPLIPAGSSQPLTFDPRCGTTQQPISRSPIAFSGGAEYAYTTALGGLWVGGIAVDATGSGLNASGTQTSTKVVAGTPINETFATNQRQAFTTTYRARIGFVAFRDTLIFFTAGGATGKVSGNFSYTAGQPSGGPGAIATGAASWNEWRTGYSLGGGVSFAYPMLLGSRLTVEYLYTNLGTVDQTIPVVSGPNASTAFVSMKTENSTVRAKLSWGL
jgi:opacity protein-like surface antigen